MTVQEVIAALQQYPPEWLVEHPDGEAERVYSDHEGVVRIDCDYTLPDYDAERKDA